ncbi:MFS transporter [Psychromarinibacter sp. S121]|uniref:MFS transporter n=1 Tax=Psychromarinibacter sp. S121 TaxID=3415127 RepID=UPI003C7CC56B
MRQFLPISALLLGSAFLLFAGGVNGLILPVRGTAEGFSSFSLGLLGTGWAIGYVSGCLATPGLVSRVGHIRSFGVMAALAAISILASLLMLSPWAWVPLRAISGFCFAGAAMIVESWLSERAAPSERGRVFGIYTMVNLFSSTAGQMVLTLGDTRGFFFFVLGAIFYCMALVPTAISSSASPKPLVNVKIDLRGLWRNSPVALFGVFLVGISNSAFGTLSAVYAERVGLGLTSIALFASLPVLAGAVAQVPVGYLSDRTDRRWVLVGLAVAAAGTELAFILLQPDNQAINLALSAAFGAAIFSMYPVILAHANDHAAEGTAIQVSGGLLMVFGFGGIAGPLVAGVGMSQIGPSGLFATSIASHIVLILFAVYRIRTRSAVPTEAKQSFSATPMAKNATPETAVLAASDAEIREELNATPEPPADTQENLPENHA